MQPFSRLKARSPRPLGNVERGWGSAALSASSWHWSRKLFISTSACSGESLPLLTSPPSSSSRRAARSLRDKRKDWKVSPWTPWLSMTINPGAVASREDRESEYLAIKAPKSAPPCASFRAWAASVSASSWLRWPPIGVNPTAITILRIATSSRGGSWEELTCGTISKGTRGRLSGRSRCRQERLLRIPALGGFVRANRLKLRTPHLRASRWPTKECD